MWSPECPTWQTVRFTFRIVGLRNPPQSAERINDEYPAMPLDTMALAAKYRSATIRLESRELLITNFRNSEQEPDLTEPANCKGFGRIRHFRRVTSKGWPSNPLPLDPAYK